MLLPECLDDFVGEDNPVRVVDAFIEELDLALLGFAGVVPEATGRPSYHPATLLKIYLYLRQIMAGDPKALGQSPRPRPAEKELLGVSTRKCSECTTSWTKDERAARWYVRSTLGLSRTAAVDRGCVKTLDLVFCRVEIRGDQGEAFCRGPGPSPAHAAARMFGRLRRGRQSGSGCRRLH